MTKAVSLPENRRDHVFQLQKGALTPGGFSEGTFTLLCPGRKDSIL